MTDETKKPPPPEFAQVTGEPDVYHIEAAGAALKQFWKHESPVDGYISLAMMIIYMELMLRIPPSKSMENVMEAYRVIRTDEQYLRAAVERMNEIMRSPEIWTPGTRH